MTLAVGDILYDDRIYDSVAEGADYVLEYALYTTAGGGAGSCAPPALGDPVNLSNATSVYVRAREVGSNVAIVGTAFLVAAGSAVVPARIRVTFQRNSLAVALAQTDTQRLIQWTVFSEDAALLATRRGGGKLSIDMSGSSGA